MISRAEAIRLLAVRGYTDDGLAGLSDAVLDWMASESPYASFRETTVAPRSSRPEDPLHETEEALLVAIGREVRAIAGLTGGSRAFLAALGRIHSVGTGLER